MINYKFYFNFNENIDTKDISLQIDSDYMKLGFEELLTNLNKESKNFLNKLFSYVESINSGYVDSIVWYSYLATSNIELPPIKEQFVYLNEEKIKDIDLSVQRNGRNINTRLLKKDFSNNSTKTKEKPLFPITNKRNILNESLPSNDFNMVLKKTIYYNNSIEFIIAFLHCIFSTKSKHYLKKCMRCEEYYIATKEDNKYCRHLKLIDGKQLTCDKISSKLKKTQRYIDINHTHQNFLRKMRENSKYSDTYRYSYKNAYKEQVKQYIKTGNITLLEYFVNNYEVNVPIN